MEMEQIPKSQVRPPGQSIGVNTIQSHVVYHDAIITQIPMDSIEKGSSLDFNFNDTSE